MSLVDDREPSPRKFGIAPDGHSLPDATRLGRVRLQVADLARSLEYYERVIGLRAVARDACSASLAAADGRVLVELSEKPGVRRVPRRGLLGLFHFAILLPERAALGRFLAHLGDLGVHPGMSDHLVSEAIYLSDPDGLGIEVYADRPRATWREVAGQLDMATNPLDVASVMAAGGATPWRGAPEGTLIGHVHLSVSDLPSAEAFYHDGIGFDKVVWSYPGALFMSAGGYHHHLGTNTWSAGSPVATDDDARMLDWQVELPGEADVRALVARLEGRGVVLRSAGDGTPIARDPWGMGVRIAAAGG